MENNIEKKDSHDCINTINLLLEIKYKIGILEAKIKYNEKLIYVILTSLLALLIKVFLL